MRRALRMCSGAPVVHSGGGGGGDASAVVITPRCVAQIKSALPPSSFLRVGVDVGGCGGFQYRFSVDNVRHEDDVAIERDGATVVTDKTSLDFLRGAVLDYSVSMMSSAYRIVSNPIAESSCGCGTSFAIKT